MKRSNLRSMVLTGAIASLFAVFSLGSPGCGADHGGGGSGSGNNSGSGKGGSGSGNIFGGGNKGGGLFAGTIGTSGGNTGAGGICGLKKYDLQRLPPEVMIVLDRSGSMARD